MNTTLIPESRNREIRCMELAQSYQDPPVFGESFVAPRPLHRSLSASQSFLVRKRRSGSRPFLLKDAELVEQDDVSSLQLGVMDACQKLETYLREIHVSEVLPAASDIMFLNITTLEGQPMCLERTSRGWRICSMKHDSMHGDLHFLDLHVVYFDDAGEAVAKVSPAFRRVLDDCEREDEGPEPLQFQ